MFHRIECYCYKEKKKILPKPYIFSPLSHIKFSFCLEKLFLLWNCFSPGFTHEKKVFFSWKQTKKKKIQTLKKKKKNCHDIFFSLSFTHEKKNLQSYNFFTDGKKNEVNTKLFFYQFWSRQHQRENYLENRSLGKKRGLRIYHMKILRVWKV